MTIEEFIEIAERKLNQNRKLKRLECRIRYATSSDAEQLIRLQNMYKELDGSGRETEAALDRKYSANLLIESKEGMILNFCLAYPHAESLFLCRAATHPKFRRRGLYKVSEALVELLANQMGFKAIYWYSNKQALAAHKAIGAEIVKELPKHDYLMKIELTPERIQRDIEFISKF